MLKTNVINDFTSDGKKNFDKYFVSMRDLYSLKFNTKYSRQEYRNFSEYLN